MTPFGWDATDIKIVSERSSAAGASAARVHPRPPGDRTGPRVAPIVAVPDAHRLPLRPLRRDPSRSHRQAARIPARTPNASVGAHVPLPVRDPRAELRPVVARLAPRRLRSRDPSVQFGEIAGAVLLIAFAWIRGIRSWGAFRAFLRHGTLPPRPSAGPR